VAFDQFAEFVDEGSGAKHVGELHGIQRRFDNGGAQDGEEASAAGGVLSEPSITGYRAGMGDQQENLHVPLPDDSRIHDLLHIHRAHVLGGTPMKLANDALKSGNIRLVRHISFDSQGGRVRAEKN
jgi:hypothetical protein